MKLTDESLYQKFRKHLEYGGIFYAFKRALKYLTFRIKAWMSGPPSILLIQCPPWDIETPPLGIAFLTAYLKKSGYTVSVCDLNIELYHSVEKDAKHLWDMNSYNHWVNEDLFGETRAKLKPIAKGILEKFLKEQRTKVVGLSVYYSGRYFALEILKIIKAFNKNIKVVLGGWACASEELRSFFPRELVDVFVVGEGEETLIDVMKVVRKRRVPPCAPSGSIFTKAESLKVNPRPAIANLDSVPWPDYKQFDLNKYYPGMLSLFASRGCIGRCAFCNDWSYSKPYRYRSARHVFDEIKYHYDNNHVKCFHFRDLLCNGNTGELDKLCDFIIDSGIEIYWDAQAISRKEMSYELLLKLKKSGCGSLTYGVESFSQHVLKLMGKIFSRETAERVIYDTHRAGIAASVNIIVGFPGETEEDFNETLDALRRNKEYIKTIGSVSVCLANPETELDGPRRRFDLVFPADEKIKARQWASGDGKNTYEARKKRAETLIRFLEEIDLAHNTGIL